MSVFHENMLIGSSGQGGAAAAYTIERSLRFNSADSPSLSRTPASAGNRRTWTWAGWLKKVTNGGDYKSFFTAFNSTSAYTALDFANVDQLRVTAVGGGSMTLVTSAVYRDLSAWYHVVVAVDTTQATASNRVKLYVNGVQETTFSTATYPSQNSDTEISTTVNHQIGRNPYPGFPQPFNGYLAEIHFIDGQALTPSSFGETDTNGIWQPKAYTGSYGTNGFQLKFADNSAATATTLGKDTSGNGLNWTPTNLSVTAGAGNDSLRDSPTNGSQADTGVGGEVSGNYATLNPLSTVTTVTLANGNLDHSSATTGQNAIATIGVSTGKWYWEVVTTGGTTETRVGVYSTSASSLYSLAANNTVYGVRFDADAGTLDRTSDGTNWTSIATGLTSGPYFPYFNNNGTTAKIVSVNFGARAFAFTAPSGFKALCTANLPTPAITKGSTAFDTLLWTGNGSARSITGLGFNPDLVWIKGRSGATDHALYDVVRGAQARLESNNTDAEVTSDGGVTAFNSDGFSLGTLAQVNTNTATYAAWCWDAGSSTVTNTAGTISSQVRANASAGFSVVTWTGDGSASATVGHGLGVAPRLYITKCRDSTGTVSDNWGVFTTVTGSLSYSFLNSTAAFNGAGQTAPTSTTINVVSGFENVSGKRFVAYCFAPVAGFSAFGSYTGSGSSDGPFVYLGFRPAVVIVKMSSSTGNWTILDDKRAGYNVDNDPLFPNLSNAEGTTDLIDITSNGFKVRTTDATFNTSSGTYVYAAWAEFPFQYARAR